MKRQLPISLILLVLLHCATVGGASAVAAARSPRSTAGSNPIVIENQHPGSKGWQITKPADDIGLQVKGYADRTSVDKGQSIELRITATPAQNVSIEIYRMGYYANLRGRLMQTIVTRAPRQPPCHIDRYTGLIECAWTTVSTLTIPNDWTTGVYLAKLTNERGFQNYIDFVVRDDARHADILYQESVTTYQAYNNYPNDGRTGKSLYRPNSFGPPTLKGSPEAVKVSFDRPYRNDGGGQFLNWEAYMVRWLEMNGYDVAYSTDIDTHTNGGRLLDHKAFLSVGHDEYWSRKMRDAVEAARDHGVDLGFFGANTDFWQVRFEPSTRGHIPNRTIVAYKEAVDKDPIQGANSTGQSRSKAVGRPEQTLVGIMFPEGGTLANDPLTVIRPDHWIYDGTGLQKHDTIKGIVGYEYDRFISGFPGPVGTAKAIVAQTFIGGNHHDYAQTAVYRAPSGAWVFAAGTIFWSFGLWGGQASAALQRMTANVFTRFGVHAGLAPVHPNVSP